jgi:fatty-acyl-CoA synthase
VARISTRRVFNDDLGTEDVGIVAETDRTESDARHQIAIQIRDHVTQNSDIAIRYVEVVDRNWLTKTSSGKIARNANREKFIRLRFPEPTMTVDTENP